MLEHGCCFVVALGLLACSAEEQDPVAPEGQWVGQLTGTDAWVAISTAGDDAVAYICGGPTSLDSHTRWLLGSGGATELTLEADGWTLTASVTADGASGTLVDPTGDEADFDAVVAPSQDVAGLYTAMDAGCRDGVIVVSSTASQGAWCDDLGNLAEVTPVTPAQMSPVGFEVEADTAVGAREFFVEPLVPSAVAL